MKTPIRRLYLGMALTVLVVTGIFLLGGDGKKPSVTLNDGTVITVERAEVFSTWPEKFREWLGENYTVNDFLENKLGWRRDWRAPNTHSSGWTVYWEHSRHAISLKLSVNKLDRFVRFDGDPSLWLTMSKSDIYQLRVITFDGENFVGGYFDLHFDDDGKYEIIFPSLSNQALEKVLIYLYTDEGREEEVTIPLRKAEKRKPRNACPDVDVSLPLPIIEKSVSSAPEVTASLDALPVDFQENRGVRIFEHGKDITSEVAIDRWVIEPENIAVWKKTGTLKVNLSVAKKSSKGLRLNRVLKLPEFTHSDEKLYHEWDSATLNPEFPKTTVYYLNEGVYFFSGNLEKEGLRLKVAAKSKQEKLAEFKAIIDEAKSDRLEEDFHFSGNSVVGNIWCWRNSAGVSGRIVEVMCPQLILITNDKWPQDGPLAYKMACWRNGVEFPNRLGNYHGVGWMSTTIPENKSSDTYQLTIGESFFGWARFQVLLSDAEREEWAAHWLEEKAKREKAKQEKAAKSDK